MNLKKLFVLAIIGLVVVGGLFAGGAQEKVETAPGEAKGELENWTWTYKCIDEWLVPAFNKRYPNIKITTVPMAFDETHDKLFTAIAAGSGAPDFATIDAVYIQKFVDQGGLVDVTDYINTKPGEFGEYKLKMNMDSAGRIYGVPFNSAPVGLWYRKDILENNGIKVPVLWDEYLDAARKLKNNGVYITSISVAAKGMDRTLHGEVGLHALLTNQQNGTYFDDAGKVILNTPEARRSMQLMKTMVDEGLAANVAQGSPAYYELMDKNQLTSIISAAWYINVLENFIKPGSGAYGNFRFAPLPAFEKGGVRTSVLGGSELCLFQQTPQAQRDLAMIFIDWANTTLEAKIVHAQYGEFPAWVPSQTNEKVLNQTWGMTGDQELNRVFAELVREIPPWKIPPQYTEVQRILQAKMNAIFVGETAIEQGLIEAEKEANR
jgi:ABC-type glycerol-3-phosphate transport system substrate-binding protein